MSEKEINELRKKLIQEIKKFNYFRVIKMKQLNRKRFKSNKTKVKRLFNFK